MNPHVCQLCEESPATIIIAASDMDGTVLDRKHVCRACFMWGGTLTGPLGRYALVGKGIKSKVTKPKKVSK